MFPWQDILQLIVYDALNVFFEPLFWLVLALVAFQYYQTQKTQRRMFGVYNYSLGRQVLMAALLGTAGGLIGSYLLTVVGVALNQIGLGYIWPVALVLMAVNMRFLCFAYAGGLIALSNVLFGWPAVNVPQVLALVAILHVTESILIFISGRYSAVPLILKHNDGRLVGAFSLQNFWPLPLVLLAAVAIPDTSAGSGINMPDWWPLLPLGMELPAGQQWLYGMLPVVAALGYTDMAVTLTPAQRRRLSALHLALYSVVLLLLAMLSAHYRWLQPVAALVSPLGHEFLIQLDQRRELRGRPLYVPPPHGVMVLDSIAGSPAGNSGLRPGDVLLRLGAIPVNSGSGLAYALENVPDRFQLEFMRAGTVLYRDIHFLNGTRQLGIILVPEGHEQHYVVLDRGGFRLWRWLKSKLPGRQ